MGTPPEHPATSPRRAGDGARTVTAVVVAYGENPLLERCVGALLDADDLAVDVVIVDNGSTDGAPSRAAAAAGGRVRVVDSGGNPGFGAACNLGAAAVSTDVLLFVNPDVLLAPGAAGRLVAELEGSDVGIASASVRLLQEPELLNSAGGAIHFLGLGWAEGFREPVTTASVPADIAAASGAAMAMRRSVFEELGGFLAELFLYHEDAELSLRCWLRGYRVRFVPDAVALHDYEFGRNPGKLGLLERNRLILVLTCYSARLLLLLAPALLVFEMGMFALSVAQGWTGEKVNGWRWLAAHGPWLRQRRREVQALRRRPDREIAPLLARRFTGSQVALPAILQPADALLARYWDGVRRLV